MWWTINSEGQDIQKRSVSWPRAKQPLQHGSLNLEGLNSGQHANSHLFRLILHLANYVCEVLKLFSQSSDVGIRRGGGSKSNGTMAHDGVDAEPGKNGAAIKNRGGHVEEVNEQSSKIGFAVGLQFRGLSLKLRLEGGNNEGNATLIVNGTRRIHESKWE